ncbi:MAG TPA: hypothetical protein DHW40_02370 [Microbacterium sp.]|nr:hypothetical protein [Microbacterium sp.]
MGHLIYGVAPAIDIDDWTLQHLRAVMVTKLRRDESFAFTWGDEPAVHGDDTRSGERGQYGAVWISKSSSLYFSFDAPLDRPLNPEWLQLLAHSAQSTQGLTALPEPSRG